MLFFSSTILLLLCHICVRAPYLLRYHEWFFGAQKQNDINTKNTDKSTSVHIFKHILPSMYVFYQALSIKIPKLLLSI
ncbi:hypothetical protein BMEGG_01303 [Priestia megaterium]